MMLWWNCEAFVFQSIALLESLRITYRRTCARGSYHCSWVHGTSQLTHAFLTGMLNTAREIRTYHMKPHQPPMGGFLIDCQRKCCDNLCNIQIPIKNHCAVLKFCLMIEDYILSDGEGGNLPHQVSTVVQESTEVKLSIFTTESRVIAPWCPPWEYRIDSQRIHLVTCLIHEIWVVHEQ